VDLATLEIAKCGSVLCIITNSLVGKVEPVQVCFTLPLKDQRSTRMQDGCKVYIDSHMASNGSCFMVTSTIFKMHILEVGVTKKTNKSCHSKILELLSY
jgi:hypothetical protein